MSAHWFHQRQTEYFSILFALEQLILLFVYRVDYFSSSFWVFIMTCFRYLLENGVLYVCFGAMFRSN